MNKEGLKKQDGYDIEKHIEKIFDVVIHMKNYRI